MKVAANIRLFFVTLALLPAQNAVAANPGVVVEIFQEISAGIKAADVEKLAARFDAELELLLPSVEKNCTASQGAVLLREFFNQHKPTAYSTLHVGGKNNRHYGIGLLATANGRFRTTIFLQISGKEYTIQQIRIENDN